MITEKKTVDNSNHSTFSDTAFTCNRDRPIHRWVPWIAGYSATFVRETIERYLPNAGTILDPFAGVGTTLVEALLSNNNSIGFEINPYAAFACKLKTQAFSIDVEALRVEMRLFDAFYHESSHSSYLPKSVPPLKFRTREPFYSDAVLKKVLIIQDFIESITNASLKDLFRLAFASTMVSYSNYSYEPSLARRTSSGKNEILDYSVGDTLINKLDEMAQDTDWFKNELPIAKKRADIIPDSFFNYGKYISPGSVDLLITSPPYLNNYHYNRNTRPHLYWLGYMSEPKDFVGLEHLNFGKYWQTVRELEEIDLIFKYPNNSLEKSLKELRNKHPEKGAYGGCGWANYAATYFNDCYSFARAMLDVLKPGGYAIVVIGNSISHSINIFTHKQPFIQIQRIMLIVKKPTIEYRKDDMEHRALENFSKPMTVQEAGRRGGRATFQNQGVRHFKKIGRKGGRRTAELYRDLLSDFGKRGGRPRRPSLRESMEEGDL